MAFDLHFHANTYDETLLLRDHIFTEKAIEPILFFLQ